MLVIRQLIGQISFDNDYLNTELQPRPNHNFGYGSWLSYGVLYNWYTSTAGYGKYGSTVVSDTGDICPSGWRLPTGNKTTGDANTLLSYFGQVSTSYYGAQVTGLTGDHLKFPYNMLSGTNTYYIRQTATQATSAGQIQLSNNASNYNNWVINTSYNTISTYESSKFYTNPIRCVAN
ncbi:hypothetical protein IJS18_01640 [Candidatus Saccharibacteria bacterium]|nr:hypothetical protein [Candidatus Saccharibacteria bacterium]